MANNLLDKSSIILTPTAYNNGEALCVKPSDGSGDFDFSRNSAATRVNAQGLVENVQILSSNLVQNGDFSEEGVEEVSNGSFSQEGVQLITNGDFANGTNNWVQGSTVSDFSVTNEIATIQGTASSFNTRISQSISVTIGKTYKITGQIKSNDTGDYWVRLLDGSYIDVTNNNNTEFQTFTYYHTATSSSIFLYLASFYSNGSADFSIESVSVREVGQDWDTFGTIDANNTVSFANNELTLRNDGSGSGVKQNALTIGKTYKVVINVTDIVGNGFKVDMGNLQNITTIGTKTFYLTATTASLLLYRNSTSPQAVNGATITNISVKEVGQNWTLGTGWEIGNSVAISDTTASNLTPSTTLISGEKYKFTLDVAKISAGSFTFLLRFNGTNTTFATINTEGSFTFYATADATGFRLQNLSGGTTDFSVTNITAVQISSDTNLPRINYEGFSYQDALGSELVLNGTFDSNIDFWNKGGGNVNPLSWNNGKIKITNDVAQLNSARQTIVTEIGKTYKVSADVDSTNGITPRLASSNPTTAVIGTLGTIETLTYTFTATSTSSQIELFNWQNTINKYNLWDNVSVKEYLGQEVVPDSGCGSWLFEPQSTNLFTQSELFTDISWAKTQTIIEAASITLPNGLTNGYKLFANTTGGTNHWIEKTPFPTATTGQDYTLSLFVKSAGSDFIQIASSSGFPSKYQNFNISTGTKASGDISNSSITDFGNGWYRISVTETTTGTQARYLIVPILSDGGRNPQFAGNADEDGAYIWGAMLEQNSFSTSYIPTEGSTVTRNQDLCTNGGSLASINSTEGVLYAEIAALANDGTFRLLGFSDGTKNNRVFIGYSSVNNITCQFEISSSVVYNFNFTADITINSKLALKYKENDFALWVNGVKVNSQSSGNTFPIGTLTQMQFTSATSSSPFYGKTKALAVWKEALSDSELQSLTTI